MAGPLPFALELRPLDGITYIDATLFLPPPAPFWMLTRWDTSIEDVTAAEREEAQRAGVTDFDDDGFGLAFNRKEDADKVALAMASRFGFAFGVYGPDETGRDVVWLAPPPV